MEQHAQICSVSFITVISRLTTVRLNVGQNHSKKVIECIRMRICSKCKSVASAIWTTRQAISKGFYWLGMIQKEQLGFLMIWSQQMLIVIPSPENSCSWVKSGRFVLIALLPEMKSAFLTEMQREPNLWNWALMLIRRSVSQICLRKLCCLSSGTRALIFIMSLWPVQIH